VIEGPHLFERFLDLAGGSPRAPYHMRRIVLTEAYREQLAAAGRLDDVVALGAEVGLVSPSTLERLTDSQAPQGVAAIVTLPEEARRMDERALALASRRTLRVVLTHGIADPGNAGTLIRTAAGFGAHLYLAHEGCDLFGPKTLRATAGAIADIPAGEVHDPSRLLRTLAARDVAIIAAVSHGGTSLASLRAPGRAVVLLGSEPRGLPSAWVRHADLRVTIPLHRGVESLNVAVAGGILLYHLSGGSTPRRQGPGRR